MSLLPVDYPISSKNDDLMNRMELVYSISNIITNQDVSKSYTIGLVGKWGSGKTSILNLVKENLKDNPKIKFVDFSPWIYTNQEGISQEFLRLMSYNLAPGWKKILLRHSRHIRKLLAQVAGASSYFAPNPELSKLLKNFADVISENKAGIPLQDFKDDISKSLEKADFRYVVIVDDLDRLRDDEILMTMKMVRSVADFSNIIYILCYDDLILNSVLKNDAYSGKDYLDKIVNLSVNIPEINKNNLGKIICDLYSKIVGKETLDEYELKMIYSKILPIIATYRDTIHLISTFYNDYDLSKNNTCSIELLAIDLIKIKNPLAYNWIYLNRYRLVGTALPQMEYLMDKKTMNFKQEYIENKLDDTYIDIISELFPTFKTNNYYYTVADKSNRYIRDPNYVDNYFLLASQSIVINECLINRFMNIKNSVELRIFIDSVNNKTIIDGITERISYRSYSKVEQIEKLKLLSNSILTLNTNENNIVSIEYAMPLSKILTKYLEQLENRSKSIDYLKKYIPMGNLRGLIFYGNIVRDLTLILKDVDGNGYHDLQIIIFDQLIKNKFQFNILTNLEICFYLMLIRDVDAYEARSIFLEEKSADERNGMYDYFKNDIWHDWLKDLAEGKGL